MGRSVDGRATLLRPGRHGAAGAAPVVARRRRRGTRHGDQYGGHVLASPASSLPSCWGVHGDGPTPVGPHEATWSTTPGLTVTLDPPLGESPVGILWRHGGPREIPGDPAPDTVNAASGQLKRRTKTNCCAFSCHGRR